MATEENAMMEGGEEGKESEGDIGEISKDRRGEDEG